MNKIKLPFFPIFLLIFALLACSGSPAARTESAAPVIAEATATQTPVDTATATPPTDTPTAIPTDTPTVIPPTETRTPAEASESAERQPNLPQQNPDQTLQVVYTHEGNLWLWRAEGTTTQLTDSYEAFAPKISSDGTQIAYLKGLDIYNAELWVMQIDGSQKRPLLSTDRLTTLPRDEQAVGTMIGQFAWVPGQHTIAYNTIQLFEVPSSPNNHDLHLVDTDTGKYTPLLDPGQGGKFTYAPDGRQIALVTPASLSLINADGTNRRDILTFPVIYTNGGWNYYPQPVWSPDSGYLRVAIPPQDPLNDPHAFTFVWHLPADHAMPYMAGEFVSIPVYVSAPQISPDTRKVLFITADGEAFDELTLRFHDLSNGSQTALYTANLSLHNWNPDSTRFVFQQDFGADFYLGQLAAPFAKIADVPVTKNLAWVTTEQFIFTSGDYETRELRIGNLGAPSQQIAQPFGELFAFDFYPKP